MSPEKIRNFVIIAHIDHGKSTLADRMIELTGTIDSLKMKDQVLDRLDLERERGITIKLQPVRMNYKTKDGAEYILNLIDTPGHVDFSYEVSRSLAAVEGAILLVDASQGVQAQTLANLRLAQEHNLKIIPVVNKIDLPHARPEDVAQEIIDLLKVDLGEIIFASGKTGEGVEEILQAVVERVPAPGSLGEGTIARALIFDSVYDRHRGVIAFVRVFEGQLVARRPITLVAGRVEDEAQEIGVFSPELSPIARPLFSGEIGYVVTGLRQVSQARVGDTLAQKISGKIDLGREKISALPGYLVPEPMVYSSIFPIEADDYPLLRDAIAKLSLNDASLSFEPEQSSALGFGFRVGLLGMLHLEIVKERLEREYSLDLIATTPTVRYELKLRGGESREIRSPADLPDPTAIETILEPWARVKILSPTPYLGAIIGECEGRRGQSTATDYLENNLVILTYEIPLSELIVDFYDRLKSITAGYGSMSYELVENRAGDLVRLDILINQELVPSLSRIVVRDRINEIGKNIAAKLKDLIPRQQYEVRIQAALGGTIIASERITPFRKDVTAKLYGGDVTRKNKLLDKQKKGKKRMKSVGKVDLPNDVFLKIMKTS